MMIVLKNLNLEIKFNECNFHTIVIENKPLLRNVIYSFQNETPEEYFVFSKNYDPFEFRKKGIYITSAIGIDMNNKRLMAKINAELEQLLTNELWEDFFDTKNKLVCLAESLIQKSDFNLDWDCDINAQDLVKLFGMKIAKTENDFAGEFIRYIQLISQYIGVSLIVVSDLHNFFCADELDLIFKTLALNDIYVLCIEGVQPGSPSRYEKVHIIDSDLCEIE